MDRRTVLFAAAASASPELDRSRIFRFQNHPAQNPMFGKYRGVVVNNVDPALLGRIVASVPAVYGQSSSPWALPCIAGAGPGAGVLAVPPIGANVWIEFEAGDTNNPIWSGGFWTNTANVPGEPGGHAIVMEKEQNSVTLSDQPGPTGGIVLRTAAGAVIVINDSGIVLSNGQGATINLSGTAVIVNGHPLP